MHSLSVWVIDQLRWPSVHCPGHFSCRPYAVIAIVFPPAWPAHENGISSVAACTRCRQRRHKSFVVYSIYRWVVAIVKPIWCWRDAWESPPRDPPIPKYFLVRFLLSFRALRYWWLSLWWCWCWLWCLYCHRLRQFSEPWAWRKWWVWWVLVARLVLSL